MLFNWWVHTIYYALRCFFEVEIKGVGTYAVYINTRSNWMFIIVVLTITTGGSTYCTQIADQSACCGVPIGQVVFLKMELVGMHAYKTELSCAWSMGRARMHALQQHVAVYHSYFLYAQQPRLACLVPMPTEGKTLRSATRDVRGKTLRSATRDVRGTNWNSECHEVS